MTFHLSKKGVLVGKIAWMLTTSDNSPDHAPHADAEDIAGHGVQLKARILQNLMNSVVDAVDFLHQLYPIACQIARSRVGRGGTKLYRMIPCASNSAIR
jgi:hypothetical protein